ncbi:MAG: hypothetical protein GXY36_03025 [Chloroflexi bacterium]|nr:hypothetical protein [Chloroflexota bacterium]
MKSNRVFALAVTLSVVLIALVVVAFPLARATAQGVATPTPGGLGGGLSGGLGIPTSTPASDAPPGPTATTGGGIFAIPTSTPSGAGTSGTEDSGLPRLSTEELEALNLQAADIPADYGAVQEITTYTTAETAELLTGFSQAAADELTRIAEQYGWADSVGASYTFCQPNLPVSEISSEVGQLASVEAARAFASDPAVEQFFASLGYTVAPSDAVHGWLLTLPITGVCFPEEIEYSLNFEYWGFLVSVGMTANADTDPALVTGLLNQLAPVITARIDALAPQPFEPTPVPGSVIEPEAPTGPPDTQPTLTPALPGSGGATEIPATLPPAGQPTLTPALPGGATPAAPAITAEPTLPGVSADRATLEDLAAVMPTIEDMGLPAPPFSLNEGVSGTYTLEEVAANTEASGLTALGAVLREAGQRYGAIGQETRVWDTGDACPGTVGLSVELALTLFDTAEGAQALPADEALNRAWLDTGLYTRFETVSDGVIGYGAIPFHPCGAVDIYSKSVPYGRFLIDTVFLASSPSSEADMLAAIDVLTGYMISQIDAADLE